MANSPRILIISERFTRPLVAGSYFYEFEDVIQQVDNVHLVAPTLKPSSVGRRPRFPLDQIYHRTGWKIDREPQPQGHRIDGTYDLLLVVQPYLRHHHRALESVRGWQSRCRCKVLLIHEVWAGELGQRLPRYIRKQCGSFDHIAVGLHGSVEAADRALGRPCTWIGGAVDALRFCPSMIEQDRPIDVLNLGRRSPITHEALVTWADRHERWYYYDTTGPNLRNDHITHRAFLAGQCRRSRFFIANLSRFNQPEIRGRQQEPGIRHYEGAAAGAVLIGQPPDTDTFRSEFDWPDAVVPLAADDPNIGCTLEQLEQSPARLDRIRRANVTHCLLKHDWSHRWRQVLDLAGLGPMQAYHERQKQLAARAAVMSR